MDNNLKDSTYRIIEGKGHPSIVNSDYNIPKCKNLNILMKSFYRLSLILSFLLIAGSCTQEINLSNVPERGFHSNRPAQKWEESLVTGNGIMGAMVAGNLFMKK